MRKTILLLIYTIIFTISTLCISAVYANETKVIGVYFYSESCSSCQKLNSLLENLKTKHKNFILKKYNIADLKNKSLLDSYNTAYKVSEDDAGIVPIVFIHNTYLSGEEAIISQLENEIIKTDSIETIIISNSEENHDTDLKKFMNFKVLGVFSAGLVNGINPCSISMLLFFISLIMVRKVNIMKIGIAFSIGKFLAYLLLGTVFFSLLATLNLSWFHTVIKIVMLVAIVILILLNLLDYFAAKNEKYNKIRVQLPASFRKFNHKLIKKVSNSENIKLILLISFSLGMVISLGEFLCTGQIYLTTIVTILQTNASLNFQAFLYLVVYDIAFIIPLLILTYIVYKGKEVFDVSEAIREKLPLIKLVNIILFLIFGVIVFIFF